MQPEERIAQIRAYLIETWLDGDTPLLEVLWPLSGGGTVPVELAVEPRVQRFDPAQVPMIGIAAEALDMFDVGIRLADTNDEATGHEEKVDIGAALNERLNLLGDAFRSLKFPESEQLPSGRPVSDEVVK